MNRRILTLALTLLASLATSLHAQFGEPKTQAAIVTEYTTVTPGQSFDVAIELTHDSHWHSYFINDGIGTSIIPAADWTLPDGWKASDLQFSAPHEFSFTGAKVYGYEGTNYFFTTLTAPADAPPGSPAKFSVEASWQVCDDSSCLPPNSKSFDLTINIGDSPVKNTKYQEVEAYRLKAFPTKDLPADWIITANESADAITLTIKGNLPDKVEFYEYDKQIDVQGKRTHNFSDGVHTFTATRNMGNKLGGEAGPKLPSLRGILYLPAGAEGTQNHAFWIDAPFGGSADSATTETSESTPSSEKPEGELGVVFVLASLLLGGLILNLMPCVFPVIGLKIMGFVQQAGEDTKKIKLHGIAFTVGVLLSFLILAAVLFPLKSTTTLGSQLQEPWVVFSLLVIMLLLALSMAGLFEIGAKATSVGGNLTQKEGVSGSFFSGVLAVVVATPCSAPFLGPAIGAAWKFDGPLFFLSLLMMGIGLALPYITLSFFPSLVNKLPRPGAWMESFKQGMSFLLFATVGYLVWVYNGQVGEVGQKGLAIMLGITAIGAAAWIYGRWNTPVKAKSTRLTANLLALAFLAGGFVLAMPPKAEDPTVAAAESAVEDLTWETWSPRRVEELLSEGTPVYVDFTAKWCLTCQTNKAAAYTAPVRQYMFDKNVVTLKADMTKKHPEATKAIHNLDRSAIPVNVLYVPGDASPHVTRELLTADYMLDFLKQRLEE
ncbi:protein-disulfide reductase DsbD family protein [Rubritalea tangerina]|uniref:Protein-disulfide reductase DsbD family protein n=2 Tax=Rubritalea tangerina TaxID=430798 RepID=A0ABW4ZAZ1_9BACT